MSKLPRPTPPAVAGVSEANRSAPSRPSTPWSITSLWLWPRPRPVRCGN